MRNAFTSAFFDELEKVAARRKRPRLVRPAVVSPRMAVPKEERRSKWGRRLGFILGRLFKHRELSRQSIIPKLRIR